MHSADQRQTPASPAPPAKPRLLMQQDRIGRGLIDGGWWPRLLSFPAAQGRRAVKLGWFDSMPVGLLTAISARAERTDLVTVRPQASEEAASAAMRQAVTAGSREHSPAIFAAITVPAADSESSS